MFDFKLFITIYFSIVRICALVYLVLMSLFFNVSYDLLTNMYLSTGWTLGVHHSRLFSCSPCLASCLPLARCFCLVPVAQCCLCNSVRVPVYQGINFMLTIRSPAPCVALDLHDLRPVAFVI